MSKAQQQGAAIMADQEVRDWIRFACDCNNCPALVDRIRIVWSGRMTRAMGRIGRGKYEDVGGRTWNMKLSVGLFGNANSEERYNTIVHEVCHAIDDYVNAGWCTDEKGHGEPWRRVMRKCGIEPARFHRVSRSGLVVRHEYKCPNGCDEYKLSTRMHNSIRRGNHRICKKCKTRVVYSGRSGKDL